MKISTTLILAALLVASVMAFQSHSALKQVLSADSEDEGAAFAQSAAFTEIKSATTFTPGTCINNIAAPYNATTHLTENLMGVCSFLAPYGMSLTLTGSTIGGTAMTNGLFSWNAISFVFTLPASGILYEGIQLAPPSPMTVTLAAIVGAITDGRISSAGLDVLSFTFNSVCFSGAFWSAQPLAIRFSGSVNIYSAVVPFDILFTYRDSSYNFGIAVQLASVAQLAFTSFYTKFTGRTDSFFTITQLSIAYGTSFGAGLVVPGYALIQPTTGIAIIQGLQISAVCTLNTAAANPVLRIIALALGGQVSLILTFPVAPAPITIVLGLGNYTFGSTLIYGVSLTLTLPQAALPLPDMAPAPAGGNVCSTIPAGCTGITIALSVSTLLGGVNPVVFNGMVSVALGATAPTFSVCLSMIGTINNVFGLNGVSITNPSGSLSFTATPPYFAGIMLQSTFTIGTFSATAAFSYNIIPALNYAFLELNSGLTIGTLISALNGVTVPAWLASTGFAPGSYFAYSGSVQTINGITIPVGISSAGTFTLFGISTTYAASFSSNPASVTNPLGLPSISFFSQLNSVLTVGSIYSTFTGLSATPAATYLGCFKEEATRDLPNFLLQSSSMTPAVCQNLAMIAGYQYFGVQYSTQCYAGNTYGEYGLATNCNMACAGASSTMCGGSWANSIYSISGGIPSWLANTGLNPGSYMSLSIPFASVVGGHALPQGISFGANCTIFGWGPIFFSATLSFVGPPLYFVPTGFTLVLPPITIGKFNIYASSAATTGPSLSVNLVPFSAQMSAYVSCGEFAIGVNPIVFSATQVTFNAEVALWNDLYVGLAASIPLGSTAGAPSFSAVFNDTYVDANPAVEAAIATWGNELPAMTTNVVLLAGCNGLFDNACASYAAFRASLIAGDLDDINFVVTISGTLGAGQTSFAASLAMSIGSFNMGPYSISYVQGQSFAKQFPAFGTTVWNDISSKFGKYF